MLRFFRDPQTKEFLIAGTGQQHIEVVVSKMKKRYHAEVVLKAPEGSLPRNDSRQSRRPGTPQKANRRPRPIRRLQNQDGTAPRNAEVEFEFVNDIFGGAIPAQLHPRRRKRNSKTPPPRGFLAGYPVVNFRAILYDGSYHDVDSNHLTASRWLAASPSAKPWKQTKPTLLEPIMHVEITIPDEFAGTSWAT